MGKATTKTILSRILLALYVIAVCLVCFVSSSSIPSIQKYILGLPSDKVIHFTMFAPYPILAYLSFDHPAHKPWKSVAFVTLSMLAGLALAIFTEVIQYYLPSRSMDIRDFYADALAVVIFSVIVLVTDLTGKK